MKPSYSWVEAGSGSLGKLYVEILKCDNLPNMDSRLGSLEVGYTDAFCCIIFEDSILNTDVIQDDLNPRCTFIDYGGHFRRWDQCGDTVFSPKYYT
jgi:hypothetical protein